MDLPAASASRIVAKGLSVERGDRPVLRDLDLTLEGGQVTAIVGRNGAGKTTLLRALASYILFGALGGLLGGLTLMALRRAGFFAYIAEKK